MWRDGRGQAGTSEWCSHIWGRSGWDGLAVHSEQGATLMPAMCPLCRAMLAAQREEHEKQLACMTAKQSALLAEGEQQAQQVQQLASLAVRQQPSPPRQQARQAQQQGGSSPEAQQRERPTEERHAADVARVLTRAIFSSVLAQQQAAAAASAFGKVCSPGPALAMPPGELLRGQDIAACSGHASLTSSARRQAGRVSVCRITAAAHAGSGAGSGAGSPLSAPRSARRQLLLPEGEPAGQHSPRLSRMSTLRGDLSQAAEAALAAGVAGAAAAGAANAAGSVRGSFGGMQNAAAAEAHRLAGELEEALAECER